MNITRAGDYLDEDDDDRTVFATWNLRFFVSVERFFRGETRCPGASSMVCWRLPVLPHMKLAAHCQGPVHQRPPGGGFSTGHGCHPPHARSLGSISSKYHVNHVQAKHRKVSVSGSAALGSSLAQARPHHLSADSPTTPLLGRGQAAIGSCLTVRFEGHSDPPMVS